MPGSYSLAYDAARKAITAAMVQAGYRVRPNIPGYHHIVGQYGAAAFSADSQTMGRFDTLRRKRNSSEYRVHVVSDQELTWALDASSDIVAVVAASATW